MRVGDLVGRAPVTCREDEPVECAVAKMRAHNVGSVAVVDGAGRPVGIFTERDLVRAVADGLDLRTPLGRLASRDLVTVDPRESIPAAAMKMIEHGIRHLPVVEGERLVGMISIRDVLRALVAAEAYP